MGQAHLSGQHPPTTQCDMYPSGSILAEELASWGFSSTRDFRNTQLPAKHSSDRFTFPFSRGAPATPPLVCAQRLPMTHTIWMGLDVTLPQGPSHALHPPGMPQRLHSPYTWQGPNLCRHKRSFPSDTHHPKPTEQFNFSMSTPILKTAKHLESRLCSYHLASHLAPAPAVLFLSPLLHANPQPSEMFEFEIHPQITPRLHSPRQNHPDQRDEFRRHLSTLAISFSAHGCLSL